MPLEAQPLTDADLAGWIRGDKSGCKGSESPQPIVYVSFGASFLAPDAAMPALAHAINVTKGQMRFLLRLRDQEAAALRGAFEKLGLSQSAFDGEGGGDGSLFIRERFPQNDVLGRPEVAAFVTQGGYLSVQEAAFHGVPVGGVGGLFCGFGGGSIGCAASCGLSLSIPLNHIHAQHASVSDGAQTTNCKQISTRPQIIGVPLTLGQGELVQHAADHGRGAVVRKEGLMRGDGRQLARALLDVVVNNRTGFKQQVMMSIGVRVGACRSRAASLANCC
jgi:hypothetical protein